MKRRYKGIDVQDAQTLTTWGLMVGVVVVVVLALLRGCGV